MFYVIINRFFTFIDRRASAKSRVTTEKAHTHARGFEWEMKTHTQNTQSHTQTPTHGHAHTGESELSNCVRGGAARIGRPDGAPIG